MNDGDAMYASILGSPGEDLSRRMYADWLVENGQPERAEFIRVQLDLARMEGFPFTQRDPRCGIGGDDLKERLAAVGRRENEAVPCAKCWPEAKELRRRERELLKKAHDWFRVPGLATFSSKVGGGFEGWQVKESGRPGTEIKAPPTRGFISAVTCSWEDFQAHVDDLIWPPSRPCRICEGSGLGGKCQRCIGWTKAYNPPPYNTCKECNDSGRERCPHCTGGMVLGSMMPCQDCERTRKSAIANGGNGNGVAWCSRCSGSGRIPRPKPSGAQPVQIVTLTTWPDGMTRSGVGSPEIYLESALSELRERWPMIETWNLPTHESDMYGLPPTIQHSDFTSRL